MSEDLQSVKFGIALPKPVVHEIEEEARKLGMTRSEYIAKVLTGELKDNREREAISSRLKRNKNRAAGDNIPYIRKLIEDSQDWLGGFDLESCALKANTRLLVGEELDPSVHPEALRAIVRRYRTQAKYWGYTDERKIAELRNFAKAVGITERQILQVWQELSGEDS